MLGKKLRIFMIVALSSELLGAKESLFSWKKNNNKKENPALPGPP